MIVQPIVIQVARHLQEQRKVFAYAFVGVNFAGFADALNEFLFQVVNSFHLFTIPAYAVANKFIE